ncbi:unnamed protein product [Closterium sp. NIES-54]
MSSAYHPQTDGQTERLNQVVEQLLRTACKDDVSHWDTQSPTLEFAYNNASHAATGKTPFFLCYGQEPLTPQQPTTPAHVQAAHDFVTTMQQLWEKTQRRLTTMQTSQKQYADRQRRDHSVAVGDQVLLDTRNSNLSHLPSKLRYILLALTRYMEASQHFPCSATEALQGPQPTGPAPSGVSQVDPLPGPAPVQVAVDSGAARGAASEGAASGSAASGGAESEGAGTGGAERGGVETGGAEPGGVATGGGEPGGAEPEGVEPRGAASEGAESRGSESQGAASSGGSAGASPRLSPQQLREWFVWHTRLWSGASGAGGAGAAGAGGTGVAAGAGVTRGTATTGPGGARTGCTRAAGTGGVEGAGAGDLTESGTPSAGGAGAGGARVGGPGAGGARLGGPGVGGAGAGGAGAVDPGGAVRPRPYFFPLLQQVLCTPPSASLPPPLLCPSRDQTQPPLQPASPLHAPSPYTEQSSGLTERREPASRPVSPVRTARRIPRSRPPPVPGTHAMTLRPSSVPLLVPLPAPPESSLPKVPGPESDRARAASPTVSRLLATAVTDPSFDPPSVGGECALGTDVLEDRQEDFECLAAAVPRFASMLLAPEGDPDAPDIPTLRSYAEAITGPYSSQWQAAMDAEMASWKSSNTYVDEVPPPGANMVDGMWIFRGVDYFQTFSPTPKMTTLQVLLHVAAQRDYELHSLDFSTAFLHEEI